MQASRHSSQRPQGILDRGGLPVASPDGAHLALSYGGHDDPFILHRQSNSVFIGLPIAIAEVHDDE